MLVLRTLAPALGLLLEGLVHLAAAEEAVKAIAVVVVVFPPVVVGTLSGVAFEEHLSHVFPWTLFP